ncbi:MAG: alpha/beta hydrolase [Sphaerochaetaceae bacterium]
MDMYELTSHMRSLINIINKETSFNPNTITQEKIEKLNDSVSASSAFKHALGKYPSNIESETFIIPVIDGAITGYYFRKRGIREMSDVTPLIIFFHGGGWMFGNMNLYNNLCARLSDCTHAPVLSVDYRLAPKYKFPTAVEDCYSTLVWAAAGCRYWKIDPDRIYVIGDCAGANLAAVVSRLARDRKGPTIAGQVLICPITDGRMRTASYEKFKDSPTLTDKQVAFYINQYAREPKDILNPNFSPLLGLDQSRLPETLIICAEYDPLRDDGSLYAQELIQADTKATFLEVKNTVHGFIRYYKATGTDESFCAISQFVSGRPVDQVTLITHREYEKALRREMSNLKRKNKHLIPIETES